MLTCPLPAPPQPEKQLLPKTGAWEGPGCPPGPHTTMPGTRGKRRWHSHQKISPRPVVDMPWAAGRTQAADAPTGTARLAAGHRLPAHAARPPPAAPGALCPLHPQKDQHGGERLCGRTQQPHPTLAPGPGRPRMLPSPSPHGTWPRGRQRGLGHVHHRPRAASFTAKSL